MNWLGVVANARTKLNWMKCRKRRLARSNSPSRCRSKSSEKKFHPSNESDGVRTRCGIAACACMCVECILYIYIEYRRGTQGTWDNGKEVPNGNVCISNITIYTNRSCQAKPYSIPIQQAKGWIQPYYVLPIPVLNLRYDGLCVGLCFSLDSLLHHHHALCPFRIRTIPTKYVLHTYTIRVCMPANVCGCRSSHKVFVTRTRSIPFKVKE